MKLTVVGCGDAFGSGGRLNTCFHLETGCHEAPDRVLIDCGATAMIGMNRLGLDPNAVSTILISHLHGDHFAGLVWWLIHAQHVARRTVPLLVVGPPGIERRFAAAAEALFPGSTEAPRRFDLAFREIAAGRPMPIGAIEVEAFEVSHPSGSPSHGLRVSAGPTGRRRVIAYSGDTQWTDSLVPLADDSDLLLLECYGFDTPVRGHLDWRTIERKLDLLAARRIVLTHMNTRTLALAGAISHPRVSIAADGLVLEV